QPAHTLVPPVLRDRQRVDLRAVEAGEVDRDLGRRPRAERAERRLRDGPEPDRDLRATVVAGSDEQPRDPERPAQTARQKRDPDDAVPADRGERSRRERAPQRPTLDREAVDEERGEERLEAPDAERVPDADADDPHRDLAAADVVDGRPLVVELA